MQDALPALVLNSEALPPTPMNDTPPTPAFPASPAELLPDGGPTYRLHQRLIGFRRRHPWLVRARTSGQHLTNEAFAFRAVADGAEIIVLLNAGDSEFRFPVDLGGLKVALTPEPGIRLEDPLLVPRHSWVIFGC